MPTLPNEPLANEPHRARRMAESFGVDAERYDRARPQYPDALIAGVVAAAPGTDVLDVGCGTGIVARQFRAAGCRVLGVEPDARMAAFAGRTGIPVEVATFEDWDPAGRTFDAVVCGQAWHWVDPVAGAAKAAAVLRAGGRFAEFWHVFEPPPPVAEAFAAAYRRLVPDAPFPVPAAREPATAPPDQRYQGMLTRAADGLRAAGGFDEPEQWRFDWERWYTRAAWLDLLPTTGGLTRLSAEVRDAILAPVGTAIDDLGGGFTMQYTTFAVTARALD